MSPRVAGGLYLLWAVLFLFNSAMDNLLVAPGRETLIDSLTSGQIDTIQGAGILQIPSMAVGVGVAFWSLIIWDFSYLNNPVGIMVKLIFLMPISFGAIVGFLSFIWPILSSKVGIIAATAGIVGTGLLALANLIGL